MVSSMEFKQCKFKKSIGIIKMNVNNLRQNSNEQTKFLVTLQLVLGLDNVLIVVNTRL